MRRSKQTGASTTKEAQIRQNLGNPYTRKNARTRGQSGRRGTPLSMALEGFAYDKLLVFSGILGFRGVLVLFFGMCYTRIILCKGAWRTVFGISMGELVLIMVVALIVLGPKQLLETAKVAGKVYRELVRMAGEIRNSVDLDALTSDHGHYTPPSPPPPVQSNPTDTGKDAMPPVGEKTGPDFYADLLESAREQVRETSTDTPQDQQVAENTEKDHQPAEAAKTT